MNPLWKFLDSAVTQVRPEFLDHSRKRPHFDEILAHYGLLEAESVVDMILQAVDKHLTFRQPKPLIDDHVVGSYFWIVFNYLSPRFVYEFARATLDQYEITLGFLAHKVCITFCLAALLLSKDLLARAKHIPLP